MNSFTTMSETWIVIACMVIAFLLIMGFMKKRRWMWILAGVIALSMFTLQPDKLKDAKDSLTDFVNNAISPLEDDNYEDESKELNNELDNIHNKLDDYLSD